MQHCIINGLAASFVLFCPCSSVMVVEDLDYRSGNWLFWTRCVYVCGGADTYQFSPVDKHFITCQLRSMDDKGLHCECGVGFKSVRMEPLLLTCSTCMQVSKQSFHKVLQFCLWNKQVVVVWASSIHIALSVLTPFLSLSNSPSHSACVCKK